MNKRGQLFLIEVIIALTVLVILVSVLFSIQSYTPSVEADDLTDNANTIIDTLVESGLMYTYLDQANYSYYTVEDRFLDVANQTKIDVKNTIINGIPSIANFKVFTERYNETVSLWDPIDSINLEQSLPAGTDLTLVEFYTPGFNGVYAQFIFKLYIWYEVSA